MNQQSLNKAIDIIIDSIQKSDINELDKMELIMNLYIFLTNYDNAIKKEVLNDNKRSTRKI